MAHSIEHEWQIDYLNKRIYVDNGKGWPDGTVVYTVNNLYSYLQNTFDELTQMDDEVPMSAQTPTEYTMINGWFIDDESVKYLKQGAIKTSGYTNNIRVLTFESKGYVDAVVSDITKTVTGGTTGDTGILLAYNNTTRKWFIRPSDPSSGGDEFDVAETISIGGGTGSGKTVGASVTGEDLYANIYTLGTIASDPYPHMYVSQKRNTISRWWPSGHIDVLIKVKESDNEIDNGSINVFARQFGDLFDNFEIDLSPGGRNAIPLSTGNDLNNESGEAFLLFKKGADGAVFTDGEILTGSSSGATAEIYSVNQYGTSPGGDSTGVLEIGNIIGTFQHNETITDTGGGEAKVQGTLGETFIAEDGEGGAGTFDEGDIITVDDSGSDTTASLRGYIDEGSTGLMVLGNPTGAFNDNENISNRLSAATKTTAVVNGAGSEGVDSNVDYDNIRIIFVNGYLPYTGKAGTFTEGEIVQGSLSRATGVMLEDNDYSLIVGNVESGPWSSTDYAAGKGPFRNGETVTGISSGATATINSPRGMMPKTTIQKRLHSTQPYYPYNVVIDLNNFAGSNGRTVAQMYEYLKRVTREDAGSSNKDKRFYTYLSRYRKLTFKPSGSPNYDNLRPGDIGATVTGVDSGDTGVLISYDNTAREWIVLQDSYTDYFDTSEVVQISTHTPADRGVLWGSSTIEPLYGQHYQVAWEGYTPTKQSPFGTFAGGVFFGARGVWIQNMATSDTQNYQLIDADGNTRTPPNFQNLSITSVVSGDRCAIFRADVNGNVDKSMFTSSGATEDPTNHHYGNYTDSTTFRITTSIPSDTPESGYIRIVRRDAGGAIQGEERYSYESWSGQIFTLDTTPTGSTKVRLSQDYDLDDTCYVPYIDEEATGTSVSVTVIYGTDRSVLARVRKKGILPFESSGTFTSSGFTVAAIRTTDTIVT